MSQNTQMAMSRSQFFMPSLLATSENIRFPAKPGDVGYNLIAHWPVQLWPKAVGQIPCNVCVKIPDGYWGLITARSSSVFKRSLLVFPGVIDSGYTGELIVACMPVGNMAVKVEKGDSIAQLVLFPAFTPAIQIVDMLPETDRGESRFGSTGQ